MVSLVNFSHVCIAHRLGELGWVNELKYPYTVVSSQHSTDYGDDYVFLQFIVHNYENLWGIMYFVSGDVGRNAYGDINNSDVSVILGNGFGFLGRIMYITRDRILSKPCEYYSNILSVLSDRYKVLDVSGVSNSILSDSISWNHLWT